ncbi:CoA-binding protein [Alkaliphilus serpentinus]|uniref:CoA-binding protein n=1 Tax=Alkaliphilus serpentinus TaxID=1482731 RepID=A0A833HQ45_9FIRM|nr:CoA-binding protein [Alkaliphilus serpentinus]KAB3531466.1 CoA-binding protein [Alkaliphilus serpentinus]
MDQIESNKKEMLKKKTWAVVGATPDPSKFGYKIFKKLKSFNYEVYGVNPKHSELDGETLYSSLRDLPIKPECIDVVVNPTLALKLLEEVKELGIEYVWFQPGTNNGEVIDQALEYGIKVVYDDCVLVALG